MFDTAPFDFMLKELDKSLPTSIGIYDVDSRCLFPIMKEGVCSEAVYYLVSPNHFSQENKNYYSFGVSVPLPTTHDEFLTKFKAATQLFEEELKNLTAQKFDPDGGDLGLSKF